MKIPQEILEKLYLDTMWTVNFRTPSSGPTNYGYTNIRLANLEMVEHDIEILREYLLEGEDNA